MMIKMDFKNDEVLWSQKYRPRTVSDTILPEKTKATFQKFVDDKSVPNLLLNGPPGTGKTTVALAMLEQLGCDYFFVNGSLDGGIDTIRNDITSFASSVSFKGGRKYVIIDEADYISAKAQASFRSFVEEFSKNCGFIFTCNYKNRILEPLRNSRFSNIDFTIENSEKPKLAATFYKRVLNILKNENVEYDAKVVAKVVEKFFPDFRRVLTELQTYAASGRIDEGIFVNVKQETINDLFVLLKNKDFDGMINWCSVNSDQDCNELFNQIYRSAVTKVKKSSLPGFIVELGKYSYQHSFVANPEINLAAFLTVVMFEADYN
jgi:DNA polymerase III delta prime subunit